MSDDIIIPARDWVGSVPAGCPVASMQSDELADGWRGPQPLRASAVLRGDEGIDLTPPPLDADGYPVRMDALPVVRERVETLMGDSLGGLLGQAWEFHHGRPTGMTREIEKILLVEPARDGNNVWARIVCRALFAYRGPKGERAWEVTRG